MHTEEEAHRAAMNFAWGQLAEIWPPPRKLTIEQADQLAEIAARIFWRSYCEARNIFNLAGAPQ